MTEGPLDDVLATFNVAQTAQQAAERAAKDGQGRLRTAGREHDGGNGAPSLGPGADGRASDKDAGATGPGSDSQHAQRGNDTQAARIVRLAENWDLFHTPDDVAYATFRGDRGELQTWPLGTRVMRDRLEQLYYTTHTAVPGAQAVQDALGVLIGTARFGGAERSVSLRLAEHDGVIYVDLCDQEWRVVAINAQGWRIVTAADAPVRFRRSKGMLALPEPQKGGCIERLRPFLNIAKDDEHEQAWRMIVAWLVAALRPRGPYPILLCVGEHGTAKSTTQRLLRSLIDPHRVPLRRPPRDERDLAIAATNSWVPTFENVSHVPVWLSDALCALATGGGFGTRQLYADAEEALFDAQRPIMINGIEVVLTRGDALDRALIVQLPTIGEEQRRRESELWPAFERERPAILGALLDAVVVALQRESTVTLDRLPRMADFACWATAAEPGLGWAEGSFMEAYDQTRAEVHGIALEASLIAAPLFTLVQTTGEWHGTARELHQRLTALVPAEHQWKQEWPRQANALSGQLRRIAPHLRALGLCATTTREGKERKRVIHLRLEKKGETSSASSTSSARGPDDAHLGVHEGVLADDGRTMADDLFGPADDDLRVADDADDDFPTHSRCSDCGVPIPTPAIGAGRCRECREAAYAGLRIEDPQASLGDDHRRSQRGDHHD